MISNHDSCPKRPRVIPFLLAVALLPCIGLAASGAVGSPAEGEGYPSSADIRSDASSDVYDAMSSASGIDLQDVADGMRGHDFSAEHPRRPDSILPGLAPFTDRLEEIRRAAATAASIQVRPGTVTMTGDGSVRVAPDAAALRFGIVTEEETASAAMTRNAATSQSIRDALLKGGLKPEEISTEQISLETVQPMQPGPLHALRERVKPQYRARNIVAVEIGGLKDRVPAFLGDLIGSAVDAGATEVSGPDFKVLDDARPVAAARKAAVEDALVKAATFAHALGVKLGRIVQIRESGGAGEPVGIQAMRMASAPAVSSGTREVASRVTVVWEVR